MKKLLLSLFSLISLIGFFKPSAFAAPPSPAEKKAAEEEKKTAIKSIEEFCQKEIDKKLRLILSNEGNKKLLDETIQAQTDLAVFRTALAFLQLQKRYNDKKGKEKDKDSLSDIDEKVLDKVSKDLENKFAPTEKKDMAKNLTDFYKFIKGSGDLHSLEGGTEKTRIRKVLEALKKVSQDSGKDHTLRSNTDYTMSDGDITLMEKLQDAASMEGVDPVNPYSDDKNKSANDKFYGRVFYKLQKTFQNRNFVESDKEQDEEQARAAFRRYNEAKVQLSKNIQKEMEEFVKNDSNFMTGAPEDAKWNAAGHKKHTCESYFKKIKNKDKSLNTEGPANSVCFSQAYAALVQPQLPTKDFECLVDFLSGKKNFGSGEGQKVDLKAIDLDKDHARTLYSDLLSCKIAKNPQTGCWEAEVKINMEHLPGEDHKHAEWFFAKNVKQSAGVPVKCVDTDPKTVCPYGPGYFKLSGFDPTKPPSKILKKDEANELAKPGVMTPVHHGSGTVPHHAPVTKKIQLCNNFYESLTMFSANDNKSDKPVEISRRFYKGNSKEIERRVSGHLLGNEEEKKGKFYSMHATQYKKKGPSDYELKDKRNDQFSSEDEHKNKLKKISFGPQEIDGKKQDMCEGFDAYKKDTDSDVKPSITETARSTKEIELDGKVTLTLNGGGPPEDFKDGEFQWVCADPLTIDNNSFDSKKMNKEQTECFSGGTGKGQKQKFKRDKDGKEYPVTLLFKKKGSDKWVKAGTQVDGIDLKFTISKKGASAGATDIGVEIQDFKLSDKDKPKGTPIADVQGGQYTWSCFVLDAKDAKKEQKVPCPGNKEIGIPYKDREKEHKFTVTDKVIYVRALFTPKGWQAKDAIPSNAVQIDPFKIEINLTLDLDATAKTDDKFVNATAELAITPEKKDKLKEIVTKGKKTWQCSDSPTGSPVGGPSEASAACSGNWEQTTAYPFPRLNKKDYWIQAVFERGPEKYFSKDWKMVPRLVDCEIDFTVKNTKETKDTITYLATALKKCGDKETDITDDGVVTWDNCTIDGKPAKGKEITFNKKEDKCDGKATFTPKEGEPKHAPYEVPAKNKFICKDGSTVDKPSECPKDPEEPAAPAPMRPAPQAPAGPPPAPMPQVGPPPPTLYDPGPIMRPGGV